MRDGYRARRCLGPTAVHASVTRWWAPVRGPQVQSAHTVSTLHVPAAPAKQLDTLRAASSLPLKEKVKEKNNKEIVTEMRGGVRRRE